VWAALVCAEKRLLAAELERHLLAAAGRRLANDAADFRRSGERDLVNIGMLDERLVCAALTGDHVDNARRQVGGLRDLREAQRGERREFGGLQDHGVSGR